jgi:hypothetical protein
MYNQPISEGENSMMTRMESQAIDTPFALRVWSLNQQHQGHLYAFKNTNS